MTKVYLMCAKIRVRHVIIESKLVKKQENSKRCDLVKANILINPKTFVP